MKLPKFSVLLILIGLYAAAVTVRGTDAGKSDYLYFDDVSATNFRYAHLVARTGSVPALDSKAAWPEGVPVAQIRPLGIEYARGYAFRLVKYLSEVDERPFTKQFSRLFLSLLVFSIYGLTLSLWRNREAALLAAFIIACFNPLVRADNGSTFLHFQFAIVLICGHLALLLRARFYRSLPAAALAAVVSFLLLAVWEGAAGYLAVVLLISTAWPGGDRGGNRPMLTFHLVLFIAAATLLPHLNAQRIAFSWPAAGIYTAVLYSYVGNRLPLKTGTPWRGALYLAAGTTLLAAALGPIHSGSPESTPLLRYILYRLRYLAFKPDDPAALPVFARYLWSAAHAPPGGAAIIRTLSPFVLFIPAVVLVMRGDRRFSPAALDPGAPEPPGSPGPFWPMLGLSGLSILLYSADRSLLPVALLVLVPLAAASILKAGRLSVLRRILAGLGAVVILGQTVPSHGQLDVLRAIPWTAGRGTNVGGDFLRFSIGEPDRSLFRFLLTRIPVRDPILSLPRLSSLLATFSGRTTLLVPGIDSSRMAEKTAACLNGWYQSEDDFYTFCRANGIEYVLYSIDLVLDGSNYSPAYLSGIRRIQPASTAYKMHFFPETLTHFNLMYENDVHRLFKVTAELLPIFSTDHPLVYQYEIIERNNDTMAGFYERVQNLFVLYKRAGELLVAGNHAEALDAFNACISQAPHFTAAILGRATALSNLGELEATRDTYLYIIGYAPDNPEALYGTAFSLARLNDTDQARGYIEILLSSTGDKKIIQKAKLLRWFIEEDIPVDGPGELPDSAR